MTEIAAETRLWDLARGALGTRALGVVADLRVADALADGPRHVDDIAGAVDADPDTLHRYLRALASEGVFAEEEPRTFRNTETSELLRSDHAGHWQEFAHLFAGVWFRTVVDADASSTEPTFPNVYGDDFWSWLGRHPDERRAFDRAMAGGADSLVAELCKVQWRGDETVVDVGGGNGAVLLELLRRFPGLTGIVFDLPETERDEASFGERCRFVPGSFFDTVPEGDVYVLSSILHDWDDEHAGAILRSVRSNAPRDARLLILDGVIPPGNEPHARKWLDLLMLTLLRGRERTEAEWRTLLEANGYVPDRIEDRLIEARCR